MGAAAGGVLAAELCAPLLLLCWLCCWPDDGSDSNSSSGGHPRKPVIAGDGARRGGLRARLAGSAVSLHLPGPSGSPRLPAHRSHEDLSSARHHSAPSVIHEVLHRRDWEHSSRELYVPLRPPSPPAPRCKKHHANIKRSRQHESERERDRDSAEGFYIGDEGVEDKPPCPGKEEKQNLNEAIRCQEQWRLQPRAEPARPALRPLAGLMAPLRALAAGELAAGELAADRSGAEHRALHSRAAQACSSLAPGSPISVDVVGYEFLSEGGECAAGAGSAAGAGGAAAAAALAAGARARLASDGDVLAPAPRPESGAFSESDVELRPGARGERRETAI